jgi:hypothetical protein
MKRIIAVLFLVACCIGVLGCAQKNGDEINFDKMSAGEILDALTEQGYPMMTKTVYKSKGNPEEYPWNNYGCISAVRWRISDDSELGSGGGAIEVYENIMACKTRRDQEAMVSSFYPAEPYYVQVKNVFLEVPQTLAEQEAVQYKAALEALALGFTPEPFTAK